MDIETLSANELVDLGLNEYASGNKALAHACYELALKKEPQNIDALHLMGLLASSVGDFKAAKVFIGAALRINPAFVDAHINIGNIYAKTNEPHLAVLSYYKALEIDPSSLKACSNLAAVLNKQGQYEEAREILSLTLALNPDSWEAHFNIADSYRLAKLYDLGIEHYKKAISINPYYADSYFQLGNILSETDSHNYAKDAYKKAISINPNIMDYYKNLGSCLNQLHETDEAIQALTKALELDEQNISCYLNLGLIYRENNDIENAKRYYKKALSINPSHPETRYSLAMIKLLNGEFESGLKLFEERFNPAKYGWLQLPSIDIQMWQGEPLGDKRIILWGEQGLGDHIQFARYALELRKLAKEVAISTRNELRGVFENSPFFDGIRVVYDMSDVKPDEYDFYIPAISAGIYLGIKEHTIYAKSGYLKANTSKVDSFAKIFENFDNDLKIGIVWQGSKHIPWADMLRSVTLESFADIATEENVRLFSLQKGQGEEQLENCSFKDDIVNLSPHIQDMSDTLALIEHMDIVISVDTSVAHLSAASGKPTWILLQFANCWRWGLESKAFEDVLAQIKNIGKAKK